MKRRRITGEGKERKEERSIEEKEERLQIGGGPCIYPYLKYTKLYTVV